MNEATKSLLRTQSALDISPHELNEISEQATKLVFEYFETVSQRDVVAKNYAGKTVAEVNAELSVEPVPLERLLDECRTIFDLSRHNGHPRFFGYVASPSTPIGAYADLIASALNANITCWRSGPAGTEIEKLVVAWLGELIGYDKQARGLLTSGGSMANLIALLVASRRKTGPDTARKGLWNSRPTTVYASAEVHMSIAKAADILGFGRDQVRTVACDGNLRMNVSALRERIESDINEGFRPFCVVASAGTTNTGAVDPLDKIADIVREFDLWFHIDGAYGAPGILDPGKTHLFDGLKRADSVSLDPHKWLYAPLEAGCTLVKNPQHLVDTYSAHPVYYNFDNSADEPTLNYYEYGFQNSRGFRALKVWMALQQAGRNGYIEMIGEDIALSQLLFQEAKKHSELEAVTQNLSITTLRYVPAGFSEHETKHETYLNTLNEKLLNELQQGGEVFLSNAVVANKYCLRCCIVNFRTSRKDIFEVVDIIVREGRKIHQALQRK